MMTPNLFLVGAPKCATTSLYDLLGRHSEIFCPSVKEPGYFTRHDVRPDIVRATPHLQSKEGYLDLYAGSGGKRIRCDGSTSYLRFSGALRDIEAIGEDVRVIAVVRDPVELVSSYHAFLVNEAWEDQLSFERAWELQSERRQGNHIPPGARRTSSVVYSDVAMQGRQIEEACSLFGDRLKVFEMSELLLETERVSNEIQDWLGLRCETLGGLPRSNPARTPRNRLLNRFLKAPPPPFDTVKRVVKKALGRSNLGVSKAISGLNEKPLQRTVPAGMKSDLRDYFDPDVSRLERCMGRDLRDAWGWP